MNNTLKVTKYQLYDFRIAVAIFYAVIILLVSFIGFQIRSSNNIINFSGLDMATSIFIFIAGLNCFKENFKFMMANNVSRKSFYYGNALALLTVAASMALVDLFLHLILSAIMPYESAFSQIYHFQNYWIQFIWTFALYADFVFLGWMVNLVYYRSNYTMKILVSISPVIVFALFQYIQQKIKAVIGIEIVSFLEKGLKNLFTNPYIAAINFVIAILIIASMVFLLIRRAPVKE